MHDITGEELNIEDNVAVSLGVAELKIGKIIKFTPKKIRVQGIGFSGLFDPLAILKINSEIQEILKTSLLRNEEEEILNISLEDVFKNLLTELSITEKEIDNIDRDTDFIYFEYDSINYEIQAF